MAQAAARLDLPMVANLIEFQRRRVGASSVGRLAARALHPRRSIQTRDDRSPTRLQPRSRRPPRRRCRLRVELDPVVGSRTIVRESRRARCRCHAVDRHQWSSVVAAALGQPTISPPLQELAIALRRMVGCSRAVTNPRNRRNHPPTRLVRRARASPPDIYIACGISGAIQHWVGGHGVEKILAINIDPEANMVTKADYAVIGDLHQRVLPRSPPRFNVARG